MRILPPVEERLRREIRDARARDPLITVVDLQGMLERRFSRTFTRKYIAKLSDKVAREARIEIDRAKMSQRLSSLRETHRIARERLMRVLYWTPDPENPFEKPPGHLTIVEAAKNIVMLDIAVLNAEVANGLYKSVEEAAAAGSIRYPALPDEQRHHIVSAFERWGMLPPSTVQRLVAEQTTTIHATRVITVSQ